MQPLAADFYKIIGREMSAQIHFFGRINQIQEGFQIHRLRQPRQIVERRKVSTCAANSDPHAQERGQRESADEDEGHHLRSRPPSARFQSSNSTPARPGGSLATAVASLD